MRKKSGRTPAPPKGEPDGKAQRNFTDPDSRILKTKDGYIQGYNAQARSARNSGVRSRSAERKALPSSATSSSIA